MASSPSQPLTHHSINIPRFPLKRGHLLLLLVIFIEFMIASGKIGGKVYFCSWRFKECPLLFVWKRQPKAALNSNTEKGIQWQEYKITKIKAMQFNWSFKPLNFYYYWQKWKPIIWTTVVYTGNELSAHFRIQWHQCRRSL